MTPLSSPLRLLRALSRNVQPTWIYWIPWSTEYIILTSVPLCTHTHADIVYLLVITTIKTVKKLSLCSANTILKLSPWDTEGRAKNTHFTRAVMSYLIKNKNNWFPENSSAYCHCSCSSSFRCKKVLKGQTLLFQRCLPSGPNLPGCTAVNGMWSSKAWNPVFILDTLDFLGLLTLLPFNSFNHALNSSGTLGPGWKYRYLFKHCYFYWCKGIPWEFKLTHFLHFSCQLKVQETRPEY